MAANEERAEVLLTQRKQLEEAFYPPLIAKWRAHHDVRIEPQTIAGIYTEIITPAAGVPPDNDDVVLINLHGGGFSVGARCSGQIESIPMAAMTGLRVVSIDYRMAPEYQFPAATADVVAVYRELLKTYQSSSIGLYGCSAGGVLTTQTVARLQREGLPSPGALGMFFGAAAFWTEGDSGAFRPLFAGAPLHSARDTLYFRDADPNDPAVFPLRSPEMLARFPPSLLASATRDHALSSVAETHRSLVRQGVDAHLHVWDGLGHAFFFDPDLPQSREVYEIAARFFRRLGGPSGPVR